MPAVSIPDDTSFYAGNFKRGIVLDDGLFRRFDPAYAAQDNRPAIFAVRGTLFALAMLCVCLRVYVRARIVRDFGPDDSVMVAAMIFCTGVMICYSLQAQHGLGRHFDTLNLEDIIAYTKIYYFNPPMWMISMGLVKISIALLLMRLTTFGNYAKFLWGSIIFMILFTIGSTITLLLICIPVAANWDLSLRAKGHCFSNRTFSGYGMFNTVVSVVTDILYATLPLPLIWQLQANKKTKAFLMIVLGLGYLVCASAIVLGYKQAHDRSVTDFTFLDDSGHWGFIQVTVAIIAACIPTLRPLMQAIPKTISRYSSSGGGTGQSNSFSRPKDSKPRPMDSFQLTNVTYNGDFQGKDTIHAHPDTHGYHCQVEIDAKYPHDTTESESRSSNIDVATGEGSWQTSKENILPNNANEWPLSHESDGTSGVDWRDDGDGEKEGRPSSMSKSGIKRTMEVSVMHTSSQAATAEKKKGDVTFNHEKR